VLGITLGLPVLAMIAITATGSVKADFLMTFLTGGVLMAFAVGAVFEIRRLADLDNPKPSEPEPAIPAGPLAGAQAYDSAPAPSPVREIRVPETVAEAVPILVPQRRASDAETETRAEPAAVSALPAAEPDIAPAVTKAKRKGGGRRKGTKIAGP
jgi:hypothetical protein